MRVSHETIYLSLFVQSRGALRRELTRHLRAGRAMRFPRKKRLPQGRGGIRDMVSIRERPPQVCDRAVPGHWEGDLLLGRHPTAVGTLVERTSRYVMLFPLPRGYGADQVWRALARTIVGLPDHLRRSLTWDQGPEMAEHGRFTIDTGVAVYFCDPHSPWQRGSNENTNRLLRQYYRKAAISGRSPRTNSTLSPPSSTVVHGKRSGGERPRRCSPRRRITTTCWVLHRNESP